MHRPRNARRTGPAALAAALIAVPLTVTAAPVQAVTGPAEAGNTRGFTARLDIGDGQRACSGALVETEWLLTAASCFADDPAVSLTVPAGKPGLATTATIGRTDLTTSAGAVRDVVELVPHADRDLVLARLARPVPGVAPVALSTTAPVAGEELTVAGYGRTADEWAPLTLHTGTFTVDAVHTAELEITGTGGAAVCPGDTGGPALRESGGQTELVALGSRSFQGGCFGIDDAVTSTAAVDTRVDDLGDWVAEQVGAPRVTDFNCDGAEDIAVGDPRATVGGHNNAGLVRVVHGDGAGVAVLHQDLGHVPGNAEASDWFGERLAVFDHNEDGCTDLVVGIPSESVGSAEDAGMVSVLYGSRDGLGQGRAALNMTQGGGPGVVGSAVPDTGDRMGDALAAGHTTEGTPYLLMGVPGEDVGGDADAGWVFYLRGGITRNVHQDQPGVSGGTEPGDRFGSSIAGSPRHFAIGAPTDSMGTVEEAGGVWVFEHELNPDTGSNGLPNHLGLVEQGTEGITGASSAGDRFGTSLSMAGYRTSGSTTAADSFLAVGVPRETHWIDGTPQPETGRVVTLRVSAAGTISQQANIHQGTTGVTGNHESGDHFGESVAVVNTAPKETGTASTLLLAVGVPGEGVGSAGKAGVIQNFSLLDAPGDSDYWIEAGNGRSLPGTPGPDQFVGRRMHATGTHIYVGMPYGPAPYGALHALPWSNARGGTGAPVTTYEPGQGGLPASGESFGWAAR